jgi:hypothetical protein
MSESQRTLVTAGNTLATALAELQGMGFHVMNLGNGYYTAERSDLCMIAADVLHLLALAVLNERRGEAACHPTDAEVANVLALDGLSPAGSGFESRVKVSLNWFEIWADELEPVPYILLLRPCEGGFEILDPARYNRREFHSDSYESAKTWLLEDEYELVGRKELLNEWPPRFTSAPPST